MNTENKTNWFTRILIMLLGLLIASMIFYNFYCSENGQIGYGQILLIALLILLILSEAFDNLSFGKILTLSNNIAEKKVEIKDLKTEKQNLLNLLISNTNYQKQSQSVGISGTELKDILKIIKADPEKVEEEAKEKEAEFEKGSHERPNKKRIDFRKIESLAFKKYVDKDNLSKYTLREQIQLASNDPISSISPVFDGFIESGKADIFIEVKSYRSNISSLTIRESLYQRLMNVFYYQQIKGNNAYLQLLLIKLPNDNERLSNINIEERLRRDFAPAIDKGLLKIYSIELDVNEEESIFQNH